MPRTRHFKALYKDELIKVSGSNPTFTISWPDGKSIIIERFADGWYKPGALDQHWTDEAVAELGLLIEQRMKIA